MDAVLFNTSRNLLFLLFYLFPFAFPHTLSLGGHVCLQSILRSLFFLISFRVVYNYLSPNDIKARYMINYHTRKDPSSTLSYR